MSTLIQPQPSDSQALRLGRVTETSEIADLACELRDEGFGDTITYSKKVFIPLTQLCRDVCHYCTFAQTPRHLESAYLTLDEVIAVARNGAAMGCKEALFTLGEKPELRYRVAREWLEEQGFSSTIEYLGEAARRVLEETSVLPHLNPGNLTEEELILPCARLHRQWESCLSPFPIDSPKKGCRTMAHQTRSQKFD